MNKFFNISLILCVVVLTGCATDSFYTTRSSTYGAPTNTSLGDDEEGLGTTNTAYRLAERVPQEESMRVSWDITLYRSYGNYGQQYGPRRNNCEVLVKPTGSLTHIPYRCDRVEKVGRDFMVYYHYENRLVAINLQTMPGDFVQNGFCELNGYSPAQQLTARVVWQTHDTVRPSNGLARKIGCRA